MKKGTCGELSQSIQTVLESGVIFDDCIILIYLGLVIAKNKQEVRLESWEAIKLMAHSEKHHG